MLKKIALILLIIITVACVKIKNGSQSSSHNEKKRNTAVNKQQKNFSTNKRKNAFRKDLIYFADADGLHALSVSTGKEIWRYEKKCKICNTPIYYNNALYWDCDENLYSFSANDGILRWTFRTKYTFGNSIKVKDGVVYFTDTDYFYAISNTDAWEKWKIYFEEILLSSILTGKDAIFLKISDLSGGNEKIYAISPDSGEILWHKDYGDTGGPPPVMKNNTLYVPTETNLYALSLTDGSIKWSLQFKNFISAYFAPMIYKKFILLTDGWGSIYTISIDTRKVVWQFKSGKHWSFLFVKDGKLFAADEGRNLLIISPDNGKIIKRIKIPMGERSNANFVDGILTFETRSYVHGISIKTGKVKWRVRKKKWW